MLQGEYRQRWENGGMWLQGTVLPDNPDGGLSGHQNQFYSSLFGSGSIPLAADWRAGYDAQLTSNDTYLKRYDFSQLDRLVNDIFVEGTGARTRFAVTGYFFQGLQTDRQFQRHSPTRCRWSNSTTSRRTRCSAVNSASTSAALR